MSFWHLVAISRLLIALFAYDNPIDDWNSIVS